MNSNFFLTEEFIEKVLGKNGPLSKMPFYEYRKEQIRLASLFGELLEGKGIMLAEAGTGTGKSLAYLIPAIALKQRVVIATRTKALQDQLADKDLPLAMEILKQKATYIKIKGKANYLCLFYYDRFRRNPLFKDPSETDFYSIVEKWATTTKTGEKGELSQLPEEIDFWNQINIRQERCLLSKCPFFEECFLFRLKRNAEKADIIITNHHILFADCSLKAKNVSASVLPSFNNLIIDEAHEAEDSATTFFGVSVSKRMIEEWIFDCLREIPREKHQRKKSALAQEVERFFSSFAEISERRKLTKEEISLAANNLTPMISSLSNFHSSLEKKIPEDIFIGLYERLENIRESLSFIIEEETRDYVKSVEKRNSNVVLSASPINVGNLIRETLVSKMKSLILTSATLSVNDSFDYISKRLGINADFHSIKIESPFDFRSQGLFFIPDSFPDPNSEEFLPNAIATIKNLIDFSNGRAFILCTSIKNMKAIYESLKNDTKFPIFIQGDMPKGALLKEFREKGNAILVATSSFWQGVDVQGEALSLVVLDKIPFASPSEPLVEARLQELKEKGEDPFNLYQLPMAAMILKQGMGRLIRSKTDKGVVACLDSRLVTKGYGKRMLKSLPPFPVTHSLDLVKSFFSRLK